MFKTKSVLAVVLTIAMALGSMVTAFASTIPSDVVNTPYEDAAKVLGALNIMIGDDQGNFNPDTAIKRSEFAKIAVSMLGLQDVAASSQGTTKFADVAADHWASGYINVASNQKIIIGDDQGNFRPDDTISYQDAVTILVRVLGYEPTANAKGGYPTGFLVVGSETGVIQSNAAAPNDQAAIRGLVANLAYNSLTVNLMEQTGFGTNPVYSVTDKTLLVNKLKAEKIEGQVTANPVTRLNGSSSSLKDDEVEISNNVYKTTDSEAASLIGQNVIAYAKDNTADDTKTIILIQPDKLNSESLTVDGDNLETITSTDGRQLEYWLDKEKDLDTQKARIADDAIMIYNNKVTPFDASLIIPANGLAGQVELVDNNNDNLYDLVKVTSYQNYVVESISELSHRINDKYGNPSIVLDPNDRNLKYSITKDGKAIALTDLNEWDVLSVAKSLDGNAYDIKVSNNSVEGKVTEINDEKVVINGETYKIANNYTSSINLNDEGMFYLDIQGKIAAVDTSATMSDNYAYLVAAAKASGGIDSTAQFKLFKKDGTTVILNGAEKIKLDNQSGQTGEQVIEALKVNGTVPAQLVTFETNANNEVTAIRRANDQSAATPMVYGEKSFTKNFAGNDVEYKANSSKLGSIVLNPQTIVFDIPAGVTDSTEYAVRDKSMFENEATYNIVAYDVGEDLNAKAIVVTNSTGATSEESSIAVVDKITDVQNADNLTVQRLYAMQDGQMITKDSNVSGLFVKGTQPLKQGDVIQYRTNAKGEIDKITVLFDSSTIGTESVTNVSENMQLVVGKVTKKFADSMNVSANGGAVENYAINNAIVYNYDSQKTGGQVTLASAGDIQRFDSSDPRYVFMRIYKDEVKEIVIIR